MVTAPEIVKIVEIVEVVNIRQMVEWSNGEIGPTSNKLEP